MKPLKNLIVFGGTGLIGKAIIRYFLDQEVKIFQTLIVVSRNFGEEWKKHYFPDREDLKIIPWKSDLIVENLNRCSVIINLSGSNIATKKWTVKRKESLQQSRIKTTQAIVSLLAKTDQKKSPPIWFNASAIGYYDDQKHQEQDETHPPGTQFLSRLCIDWEKAAEKSLEKKLIKKLIVMRIGVVLSRQGGAFSSIKKSISWRMGTFLGSGQQGFSWIHIKEIPSIIHFVIAQTKLKGVINLTAPSPVSLDQFMKRLATRLNRSIRLRIPGVILRFILGERSRLLLCGPIVKPNKLLKAGYVFSYPNLEEALDDLTVNRG